MTGGAKAQAARPDERIDLLIADKAKAFLEQTSGAPFFLYVAWAAPHVPINPAPEFRGSSRAGLYGDFIQQLDHCVGVVLGALDRQGLATSTLVLFTSDNGAVLTREALDAGHRSNGRLLGQKTDAWEGGHRVPLLARWPGIIPAGALRQALHTQVDLMATLAEAAGVPVPAGASPDGVSDWLAFTDPASPPRRAEALFQGTGGFALRQGDWLYCPKQGSLGMTVQVPPGPQWGLPYAKLGLATSDIDPSGRVRPDAPAAQLYNLREDPGETTNVVARHPEVEQRMAARLAELVPTRKPAAQKKAKAE
jgi:arylsulfatase A-like enzyme